MRREWWKWLVVGALVAASGCTKSQGAKCTGDSDCSNPAYPFCDVNGEFPASGGDKNVCTIVPADCPVERCGCSPGATTCVGDQLLTCDPGGKSQSMTACSLGCAPDGERCLEFEPSNGLGPALLASANERDISIADGSRIDTDTGTIHDSANLTIDVKSFVVTQAGGSIRVFYGKSFQVGSVVVSGANAFAIAADGPILLTGLLDASARGNVGGPGSVAIANACIGTASANGGGGGGHATMGGTGAPVSGSSPMPGAPGGNALDGLSPLSGGCSGGGDGSVAGGAGGGAVQLVSGTSITLESQGFIHIGGGGGPSNCGGGGGGTVVLEAPIVGMSGSATGLAANGGAGGSCGIAGADATPDTSPAPSVTGACGASPPEVSGSGGTATQPAGNANGPKNQTGGGGGAVGQARIATKDGTFSSTTATVLSADVTTAQITTK